MFWDTLNSGWFSLLVGTAIGVAGIWFGYLFYKRSRQVSRLRYMMGGAPLIGPTPIAGSDGLEIRFDGKIVPRVTSTSYGLWNDGTTTIHGRDIVEADPLRLELANGAQVLRASLEGSTRSVNGVTVSIVENQVRVAFDYLDAGDGFRVQIIHSGEPGDVLPQGTIRGLPKGVEPVAATRLGCAGRSILLFVHMTILLVIGALISLLATSAETHMWSQIAFALVALGAFGGMLYFAWRLTGKVTTPPPTKGVPEVISDDLLLQAWASANTPNDPHPLNLT